jgi:uncharacterized protein YjcR
VENWIKSGKRGIQIATELGVSYPCLKDWKRRCVGDATPVCADLAAKNCALKVERGEPPVERRRGNCAGEHLLLCNPLAHNT